MRGHRAYGPRDSQPAVSLKADWGQGVNTVLPADRLPQFQFTHGMNLGLREGYPVTRPGVSRAKWMYRNGLPLGEVFQGAGLIQGADPDPVTRLPLANLVVNDNDLWLCAPNNVPTLLMEDCTDALQEIEVIDAFDEALILRNLNQTPLRYRYEAGHFPEELPAAREGMLVLPPAKTGCYTANRVWLVVGKNEVIASDIFEWDYLSTETRWQVDDGEGDEIVRLWPVGENRIVVLKTRSVFVIDGVAALDTVADVPVQVNIYRVAAARGCVAPYAIEQRGQTLYYLGRDGLEALVLSESAVSAMSDKPLSLAIERYWKELRWLDVAGSRMAIAQQHLMISVPTRYREGESIPSLLLGGEFSVEVPELPEVELCGDDLSFVTYSGSGTWCGFEGFFTYDEGITPRYLTKSYKGAQFYVNGYHDGLAMSRSTVNALLQAQIEGDDPWDLSDENDLPGNIWSIGIDTYWYGQAAYDPSDGCSVANGLRVARRTNGNPYAFLMQYGFGTPYTDEPIDSIVSPFQGLSFSFPGSGQSVIGYNTILTPSPSERIHRALGLTMIGGQLGSHTVFGDVREILGDEHTLYDQLVIDGAAVSATRSSELYSFNDETGVFSGSLSSFSFVKTAALNQLGVDYLLSYTVTIVTGSETTHRVRTVAYVGTGVANETMTVPIQPLIGSSVTFEGDCITIQTLTVDWNDFEQITDSGWFDVSAPAGPNWASQMWLTCGVTAAADFQDMAPALSGSNIIEDGAAVGACWGGDMFITYTGEPICWHDFQAKVPGVSDVVILNGGIGWGGPGWFHIADYPMGYDDFQDNTPGAADDSWEPYNGGWGGNGWFTTEGQSIGYDDFQSNTPGPATVWTSGTGWGGDGWFADEP